MMNKVAAGATVCIEATVIDSVVLGRSVLQNSVNYRSAVVMGQGRHRRLGRGAAADECAH